jgi:Xaa-Pro aminopeptidase
MAPADELTADVIAKRESLYEELERRSLDALIVSSEASFTYLTGYATPSWANRSRPMALVVRRDGLAYAIVSSAEAARLQEDAVAVEPVAYLEPTYQLQDREAGLHFAYVVGEAVGRCLGKRAGGRVGVETGPPAIPTVPTQIVTSICNSRGLEPVDLTDLLSRLRQRKSELDIQRIRDAAQTLGRAYHAVASLVGAGMTEREIGRAVTIAAADAGADRVGYLVVVADAFRPLLGAPGPNVWRRGALLHIDVGLVLRGYWADFCREFVCAPPDEAQRLACRQIADAVRAGTSAARPGVPANEVARAIANQLPGSALGSMGRFGHGVGLEIAEPPSLHPADTTELEPGMTLCIEPTAWFEGAGHLVGEQMIVVTDHGAELLSPKFPPHLIEVTKS